MKRLFQKSEILLIRQSLEKKNLATSGLLQNKEILLMGQNLARNV